MNQADPKLPVNQAWTTAKLKGPFEGSYLAQASLLDFGHSWNGGQALRFDTRDEAECERKRLHLEDQTVIETAWGKSGRNGNTLNYQFVIRRVYQS